MKKEFVMLVSMVVAIQATCVHAQQAINSTSPASRRVITVDDLASDPSAYLGQVAVVGVVAAVEAGQGFTIVDSVNMPTAGFPALTSLTRERSRYVGTDLLPNSSRRFE
jgi:hypothetical protein